jgi:PAS domain S-box-containing protein
MTQIEQGRSDGSLLRAERARYEDLFEFAPLGFLVTDAAGTILEANRTAADLLGIPAERLVRKPIAIFIPIQSRKQFRQTLLGLSLTETAAEWELELEARDGQRFQAQLMAAPALGGGLRWMIQDVSQRIDDERRLRTLASALEERVLERTEELEHERARLAAIVDQIPGGLIVADAPSGRIVMVNEQARKLLGEDNMQGVGAPLTRALEGEVVVGERIELATAAGNVRALNMSAAPVRDRAGRITAAVSIFEETTVQEARHRAEREFITNAAHELQTPLAAIMSAVEVLQAGAKDAEERDLFIDHIEREAQRLSRLTRSLLTLARAQTAVEPPRTEVIDVCPLFEALAERMEPAHDVTLTVDCPPELAVVANQELLEQMVSNVVRNAVKYTERGSIRLEAERADGGIEIRVVDTGAGIAPKAVSRVTERFYRAEQSKEGFGLGLAIVQSTLDVLGGTLEVHSDGPGRGTTVTMRLPMAATRVTP